MLIWTQTHSAPCVPQLGVYGNISFAYKFQVFGDLGAADAASLGFTVPDAIVPGIVIWVIAKIFGA